VPSGEGAGRALKGAERDREKVCVDSWLLLGSTVESWSYSVFRKIH